MLDLGTTEFYLAVPSVSASELELLSTRVFDEWDKYIDLTLSLPDYSLFLEVEEGSISGRGIVGAGIVAVYMGLGNYGDFVQGVRTVSEQLASAREYLSERARVVFECPLSDARSSSRSGTLGALRRLFSRVQSGETTAEEAMVRAEAMLGEESAEAPGFLRDLENALRKCPRHPVQMGLLPDEGESAQFEQPSDSRRPERAPRQKVALAPPTHFRIEVWRESKSKRKQTRFTQV